jgi:2-keto-3-deoxy-L-rhamnonate aldolase RhmA
MALFHERLAEREPVLLTMINVADPALVEVAAHAGFDAAVIDAEHGPLGMRDILDMIRAGEAARIPTIVRVPRATKEFVLRSLDAGAQGILFPQVNSAVEAEAAVAECRYPPQGVRGAGFYARGFRYALDRGADAIDAANAATVVGVQIEAMEAVGRATEILSQPGVDFGFVGPTDLSVDHGSIDITHPDVQKAIVGLARAAKTADLPLAIYAGTPQAARSFIDLGYRIIAVGIVPMLTIAARDYVAELRARERVGVR